MLFCKLNQRYWIRPFPSPQSIVLHMTPKGKSSGQLCPNHKYMYSRTCVKQLLSKVQKIDFQNQLSLNAGQKYCRILHHYRPLFSHHLSLRSLFGLHVFLSGRFTQVLLYTDTTTISKASDPFSLSHLHHRRFRRIYLR